VHGYIGIDASTTSTGLCCITDNRIVPGLIQPESLTYIERLEEIQHQFKEWVQKLCLCGPAMVCIEEPVHSSTKLSGLWAVLSLTAFHHNCHVATVNAMRLKKFVCGSGRADKYRTRLDVFKRWNFEHDSHDVIDAFVLAHMARCRKEPEHYAKFQVEVVEKVYGVPTGKRGRPRVKSSES
jgi:crossover junction endodeoxyribonuclease RuvC